LYLCFENHIHILKLYLCFNTGSPIFNSNYALIGLHRAASTKYGEDGRRDVDGLGVGTSVVDIVNYLHYHKKRGEESDNEDSDADTVRKGA
jgi:hypothetical protein